MKNLVLTVSACLMSLQLTAVAALDWTTDLSAAQAKAEKEKKLVLLNFTGSDWCAWCKRLHKDVFSTKEFETFAKDSLVLVEVDFPAQKKQSEALQKANNALKQKFQIQGYPTILVMNGEGKEVWRQVGYLEGGPKVWIDRIRSTKKS
jgi:protein disulfide-isomerase